MVQNSIQKRYFIFECSHLQIMQESLVKFLSMVMIVDKFSFLSKGPPFIFWHSDCFKDSDHLTDQADKGIWSTMCSEISGKSGVWYLFCRLRIDHDSFVVIKSRRVYSMTHFILQKSFIFVSTLLPAVVM